MKAHSQKLKNKYNIPYKTLYTVQNRKAKILFDLEKNKKGQQKNKKIGILTEAGIESDNQKKIKRGRNAIKSKTRRNKKSKC